jgi:hypothetical protein
VVGGDEGREGEEREGGERGWRGRRAIDGEGEERTSTSGGGKVIVGSEGCVKGA